MKTLLCTLRMFGWKIWTKKVYSRRVGGGGRVERVGRVTVNIIFFRLKVL